MNIEHLYARSALGIKPGLDVITALLEEMGSPQREFKVIHVAGTNGKGSVCAMIESVLRASGFKTGLYTSPHLIRFNERFRVNGREIPAVDLEPLIDTVLTADKKRLGSAGAQAVTPAKAPPLESKRSGRASLSERAESPPAEGCPTVSAVAVGEGWKGGVGHRPATFFELSTAIAFEYFKRCGVDYAVIETGLGGRWDATNVVQPVISVITRIALDHAETLGTDIEKIAWEKAGIIQEGVPVICGPMPVEAEAVVYKEAAEKKVPILGSEEAAFFQTLESRRTDQLLDIEASGNDYRNVRLPLGGSYQIENCGIAVAALEDISDIEGIRLQMKKGLEAVKWPGRFQMLSMKPPMIFDGAHNPNAAKTLFQTLEEIFPRIGKTYVFGFMRDKDVAGMLNALTPGMEKAFAVTLPGERAMSAEQIAEIGKAAGIDVEPVDSLQSALDWVQAGKKRLLCFTGSLYLAEEISKFGFQI